MAGNLFRSVTLANNGPVIEDELEGMEDTIAEEEAEVFEATDGSEEEAGEIVELTEDLETAQEDHSLLEENADALETELGDENYEGMEEVTALSLRSTLNVMRNHHGLTFPNLQGKITKQSFTGISRANRIERSRVVLAGIKDALIELWEKIKAGLKLMWDKLTKFWDKHFSTVGRLEKALVAARKKVKANKGNPDFSKEVQAGSTLNNLFQEGKELDGKTIIKYMASLNAIHTGSKAITAAALFYGKNLETAFQKMGAVGFSEDNVRELRTAAEKLGELGDKGAENGSANVSGWKFRIEVEKDDDKVSLKYEEEFDTYSGDEDRKISISSKGQLDQLLGDCIEIVKAVKKDKSNREKNNKVLSSLVDDLNKDIDNLSEAGDDTSKAYKAQYIAALKNFQNLSGIDAKVSAKCVSLTIKALKGALQYSKLCMKTFKKI